MNRRRGTLRADVAGVTSRLVVEYTKADPKKGRRVVRQPVLAYRDLHAELLERIATGGLASLDGADVTFELVGAQATLVSSVASTAGWTQDLPLGERLERELGPLGSKNAGPSPARSEPPPGSGSVTAQFDQLRAQLGMEPRPAPPRRPKEDRPLSKGRRGTPGGAEPRGNAPRRQPDFHHPYNFVPAPPRDGSGPLADSSGLGHARWDPNAVSGRLLVRMRVATRLLLLDHSRVRFVGDHPHYPVPVDRHGRPHVAPSSVKGMLRSAYEALTASRMGAFAHDEPLTYRVTFGDVGQSYPVRIERRGDDYVAVRLGVARLPLYGRDGRPMTDLRDGQRVAVTVADPRAPKVVRHRLLAEGERARAGEKAGTVLRTGRAAGGDGAMQNKQEIVALDTEAAAVPIDGPRFERLCADWRRIVRSYRDCADAPGAIAATTLRVMQTGFEDLAALASRPGGVVAWADDDLRSLRPTKVGRVSAEEAPIDLLDASVRPARSRSELSPADRLFGWVQPGGPGAYRGHVRISDVTCATPDPIVRRALTLPSLVSPKPNQLRFYFARDEDGRRLPDGQRRLPSPGGLRGRKVYPHQGRDDVPSDEPRSTNFTVDGYVDAGTELRFEIAFDNLLRAELGALIWLLSRDERHHLRLGAGKPFGFGSVHLQLERGSALAGDARAAALRELRRPDGQPLDGPRCNALVEEFRDALGELLLRSAGEQWPRHVRALSRAMTGEDDDLPYHYPQTRHDGAIYEWFGENAAGLALALPELLEGNALPRRARK